MVKRRITPLSLSHVEWQFSMWLYTSLSLETADNTIMVFCVYNAYYIICSTYIINKDTKESHVYVYDGKSGNYLYWDRVDRVHIFCHLIKLTLLFLLLLRFSFEWNMPSMFHFNHFKYMNSFALTIYLSIHPSTWSLTFGHLLFQFSLFLLAINDRQYQRFPPRFASLFFLVFDCSIVFCRL